MTAVDKGGDLSHKGGGDKPRVSTVRGSKLALELPARLCAHPAGLSPDWPHAIRT